MSDVNTTVFAYNYCSNMQDPKQIPEIFILFIKVEMDGEVMKFLHVASN